MKRSPALPASLLRLPIAHRALHDRAAGRIENSPSAIKAAIAAGYAIEIDVQLSADGKAMVFHDETLDRLTDETGPVNARSATELGRIALRDGAGDTIPTLPEVLALVAGQVPLLIEIKDQTGSMSDSDATLEKAVADALQGYQGDVALMSFNPHSVRHLGELMPDLARGLIGSSYDYADWEELTPEVCDSLRGLPNFESLGASFISHQASDLGSARVAQIKADGTTILCWTIKSLEAEAAARQVAQNITFERYLAPFVS